MRKVIGTAAISIAVVTGLAALSYAADQDKDGWKGAPRTFLWNSGPIQFIETAKFKKNPPWTIAVANASISNVWAVGWLHSLQYVAAQHKDVIKQLIVTDANDDFKQASGRYPGPAAAQAGLVCSCARRQRRRSTRRSPAR